MTAQAVEQENPLVEGLRLRRTPEPCVFVIFGASGDLTQRKLMPALYALAYRRLLPERFAVVGAARSAESDEEFRERMKEAVQNMLALRFANGIFEPIWNRQFIDHVQITVAESIGIEGRAAFYERAGAIRDIFQNHLLQLVAITAMEPPIDFTADSVRNEKVKVLRSLHTPGPKSVVRGQYGRGFVEGEEVAGYREEPGVAPDSTTDTFVAAKLFVDNWRWADTPFYVRAGKRLARRETTIAIQFKRAPHPPFEETASAGLRPNVLLIHVQPDEGVSLAVGAKVPGQGMTIRTVHMDFLYGGAFRMGMPEAYERLILDAMRGDATLFTRTDEVEEQWALVDAIVAPWKRDRPSFPNYPAGTWGPLSAEELLVRDGRAWRQH